MPNTPSDITAKIATEYHIQPQLLQLMIEPDAPGGTAPTLEDNIRKNIAYRHSVADTADNQQKLYTYYMAEQVADYRDTLKALVAIDSENPALAAPILDRVINRNTSPAGSINHTSTTSEYKPSPILMKMVEHFEGLKLKPYTLNGVKHIGIGHSQNAIDNPGLVNQESITPDQARAQLNTDLQKYGAAIVKKFPGFLNMPQGVQDACVSYAFNCGVDGLMKSRAMHLIETGNLVDGAKEFANGIHTAGGKPLPGLEVRRKSEAWLAQMDLADGIVVAPKITGAPTNTANLGVSQQLNKNPIAAAPIPGTTPPALAAEPHMHRYAPPAPTPAFPPG